MIRLCALALMLAFVASTARSQENAMLSGDGWEAFPFVEYKGGDSRLPRARYGVLVLTDSTIALHDCADRNNCRNNSRRHPVFKDSAVLVIRLADLRAVSASTETRGPGVGRRVMWGVLANDRTVEQVSLAYDTETTAEAPVFATRPTHAAAIEAKILFRLRRLGVELPERP